MTNLTKTSNPQKHDSGSILVVGMSPVLSASIDRLPDRLVGLRNSFLRLFYGVQNDTSKLACPLFTTQKPSQVGHHTQSNKTSSWHSSSRASSPYQRGQVVYSLLFTDPRKNRDWGVIEDLNILNKFIKLCHFHMEILKAIT